MAHYFHAANQQLFYAIQIYCTVAQGRHLDENKPWGLTNTVTLHDWTSGVGNWLDHELLQNNDCELCLVQFKFFHSSRQL